VEAAPNLSELWQDTLARLELPSTRMLLSQQAKLVRLDSQRAVVRVAGTWMAMVQSRLPLLEKALAGALGSGRQLVLEAGGEPKSPPAEVKTQPPPAPLPTSTPAQLSPSVQPEPATAQPPTRAAQPPAAHVPSPSELVAAAAPAGSAAAPPAMPSPLEEKAKRLAEFFNGEVIEDVSDQVA
jgi:DNA polymerase-3 subunit gamma/tau